MGSYTFRWEQPADQVYVTGTFDNWAKSVKLDKQGDAHEKTVDLPESDKISYKFVADGKWVHDPKARVESDYQGNLNNVIFPEDIETMSDHEAGDETISTVAPGATTTQMAGEQPREPKPSPPGAFPETPAPDDSQTFSVNPIPASEGAGNPVKLAPGEKVPDPSTINSNTTTSTVQQDAELKSKDQGAEQTFWAAPIPTSSGIGNPVHLQPGEKVPDPSTISGNKTDTNSATSAVLTGPGPVIPESSMSMGNTADVNKENMGPTMSSVAPESTTNQLAGQQPKEPRGEAQVMKDNQEDDSIGGKVAAGAAAAGVGAAGAAVAANEMVKNKTGTDPKANLPQSVQDTVDQNAMDSSIPQQTGTGTAPAVPEVVKDSQKEAGEPPEAAASSEAVKEKNEVEDALLNKVPTSDAKGDPAPTPSAAAAVAAPAATGTTSSSGAPQLGDPVAGVVPLTMGDGKGGNSALNASKESETKAPTEKAAEASKPLDSRDVSPMSQPTTTGQTQPQVTSGIDSAATPSKNGPPSSSTPQPQVTSGIDSAATPSKNGPPSSSTPQTGTPDTTTSKKDKRRSLFGKIKDKLKS